MDEYKIYRLRELVSIKYGKDHKALSDGNIPVFGSGGIMRYVNQAIYDKPSVLIPRKGSLNNIIYSDTSFWTVDTMFWTVVNENIVNSRYLYYNLCRFDFAGMNVGSAVPSLTVPVIEAIELNLPPLCIQKEIVRILKSLDDKIALNKRINDNLFFTIILLLIKLAEVQSFMDYDKKSEETNKITMLKKEPQYRLAS